MTYLQWIKWVRRSYTGSPVRKKVVIAMVAAIVYQIWRARNDAHLNYKISRVEYIANEIKCIVKERCSIRKLSKWTTRDVKWFNNL